MRWLVALVLVPLWALAGGGEAGNGGYFVVCRDHSTGRIVKVEMHDLWWGEHELGLPVTRSAEPAALQLGKKSRALSRLDPALFGALSGEIERFRARLETVERVRDPRDLYTHAFPVSRDPGRPCQAEPVVNYDDHGAIRVNREVWDYLNDPARLGTPVQSDLAALFLHEAVYKLLRAHGERLATSRRPATLVAHLFALDEGRELERWYADYRSLGAEAEPEPPAGEIELEEPVEGGSARTGGAVRDRASAWVSWGGQCLLWRRAVTQELSPRSRRVSARCGEPIETRFPDGTYTVSSAGRIILLPAEEESAVLVEKIQGDYAPAGRDLTGRETFATYRSRCARWRARMARQFGPRLLRASCGSWQQVVLRNALEGGRRGAPLAHYFQSTGQVAVVAPGKLFERTETVSGETVPVASTSPGEALVAARKSFETSCEAWKEKQSREPGFLFAACETPDPLEPYRGVRRPAWKGAIRVESVGHVWSLR